jgi:hypothetical protein
MSQEWWNEHKCLELHYGALRVFGAKVGDVLSGEWAVCAIDGLPMCVRNLRDGTVVRWSAVESLQDPLRYK